jgi:hypothetical protein
MVAHTEACSVRGGLALGCRQLLVSRGYEPVDQLGAPEGALAVGERDAQSVEPDLLVLPHASQDLFSRLVGRHRVKE